MGLGWVGGCRSECNSSARESLAMADMEVDVVLIYPRTIEWHPAKPRRDVTAVPYCCIPNVPCPLAYKGISPNTIPYRTIQTRDSHQPS